MVKTRKKNVPVANIPPKYTFYKEYKIKYTCCKESFQKYKNIPALKICKMNVSMAKRNVPGANKPQNLKKKKNSIQYFCCKKKNKYEKNASIAKEM